MIGGVGDEVVEDLLQAPVDDVGDRALGPVVDGETEVALLGQRQPGRDPFRGDGTDVDPDDLPGRRVEPRQRQERVDQLGETVDLGHRGEQVIRRCPAGVGDGVDAEAEGRQWRSELMGRVGEEGPLRLDQRLEPRRHGVERGRDPHEVGRPLRDRQAGTEVARSERIGRRFQPLDGPTETSGDEPARRRDDGEHDRVEGDQLDPHPPGAAVDRRRRIADPDGPEDLALVADRDRDIRDRGTERGRRASPARKATGERGCDLGPTRELA